MSKLKIGAHMSIAGGLHLAFERISSVSGTALQIFTRNQRQWKFPSLTDEDVEQFGAAWRQWGQWPLAVHDSYLINLANPDPDKEERSIDSFARELGRVERLSIPWLVTHPGSHLGEGAREGIARYAANLDEAIERSDTEQAVVLLETTSGQGTNLGSSFAELAAIMEASRFGERLGVCFDTCHAFAAGYDLRTDEAVAATLEEFDREVGLDKLKFVHLNDSKTEFNSRRDRHEHIGKGEIGEAGFAAWLAHSAVRDLPMTLETPKEDDLEDDRVNLALVRRLAEE